MTYDATTLIPRSVLFGNPRYAQAKVSPDGQWIGFLAPRDGVLNVWVAPATDPTAGRPLTDDRGQGIRIFGFCHDDRTLYYLQDRDGDENWQLHLLDLPTGEQECVTPYDDVAVFVMAHNQWHPDTMLVGINKDNPALHDIYRLELTNRSLTKVFDNPGLVSWLVDSDLAIRGGARMTEDGGAQLCLRDQDGPLRDWLTVPPEDLTTTQLLDLSRDKQTLYFVSSIGVNAGRLLAVDLTTGAEEVISEDDTYDVNAVELDPDTLHPQAVIYEKDRQQWSFLDAGFAEQMADLRRRLPYDADVILDRTERSGNVWTVTVNPSDGPVSYYLYRPGVGELTFLFSHSPELQDYELAPMEPFTFTARDGWQVHGYLTCPPGVPQRDLPAVLNVHGGPWARDSWGFHPEVQWLANRGYACVQVNFRGSTGYGKAFGNAGNKQWGQAMHTDLLDAVEHLAGQGIIDRTRVGIMGGSYGGYAALAGVAFTPEVFRCAVDLCGPANLLTLLSSLPPYWKPMLDMFRTRVGDLETEQEMLTQRSPLSAVDQIQVPVLIAHGANDVRVKQAEAEQIVQALQDKGLPYEYLLFEDEGHGLARPENRERYYAAVERFLAEHLGGRTEVPTEAAEPVAD